ncbi:MAG: hypothetical protein AAF215_03525 [Cyanobacteria bacterium P01_A01_bin.123]
MPEDQGDIIERLRAGTLTDNEIQLLSRLLKQSASQDASQPGKFNVSVGKGTNVHIGDRHNGASIKEIRAIVQELTKLQGPHTHLTADSNSVTSSDNLPLTRIALDPTTLETINARLDIIEEIFNAGCFSETQQQELNHLKQQLHTFHNLNRELQEIVVQGDRLIQSAIDDMRQQLKDLQIDGEAFIEDARAQLSPEALECRKVENQNLEKFINRLEASRPGAAWIDTSINSLRKYACKQALKQFPDLDLSVQKIDDFQFSLKQFLEQISFCLYWGTYDILDSPDIPFELDIEQYEAAFLAIKKSIPLRLGSETVDAIETCLDYLIERLPFIDSH